MKTYRITYEALIEVDDDIIVTEDDLTDADGATWYPCLTVAGPNGEKLTSREMDSLGIGFDEVAITIEEEEG